MKDKRVCMNKWDCILNVLDVFLSHDVSPFSSFADRETNLPRAHFVFAK